MTCWQQFDQHRARRPAHVASHAGAPRYQTLDLSIVCADLESTPRRHDGHAFVTCHSVTPPHTYCYTTSHSSTDDAQTNPCRHDPDGRTCDTTYTHLTDATYTQDDTMTITIDRDPRWEPIGPSHEAPTHTHLPSRKREPIGSQFVSEI